MLKLVGQDYSAPAPLSAQDLCLKIERTVAFLVRFIGGRTLADTQDDPLLVSGVERQVQIICVAVERLVQIDAGIAERITDYGKLVAFRTVQLRGLANLNEMFGFDQRVWHFVENRLPLLCREIAEIGLRAADPR
jgi:hypothetical protein